MKKIYVLCLLALLMVLSLGHVYAQIPSKIKFDSKVSGGGLQVCNNTNTVTIRIVNISEEDLTNFKITELMPNGMKYKSGSVTNASELNISVSNAPVFSIDTPFLLYPDDTLIITFQVEAGCELIALSQTGVPMQDQTTINYETYDEVSPVHGVETAKSNSYNILYPAPMVTKAVQEELIGNVGSSQTRTITISNPGNGNLSGFWLRLNHSAGFRTDAIKVVSDPTNYLVTSPSTTNSTTDMVYIPKALASDGSIQIQQIFTILDCNAGGTKMKVFWGCNSSSFCDSSDVFVANTVPSFGVPIMNVTEESYTSSGLCANTGSVTYKYTNNGTETTLNGGVATDIQLSFAHDATRVALSNFQISPDGSTWTSLTGGPNFNLSAYGSDPDGAGEGLKDYNGDGKYELAIGKSFYIRFNIKLDTVAILAACSPDINYLYVTPSIHYDDQCMSNPETKVYEQYKREIRVWTCGVKADGPTDMDGASDAVFNFCVADAEVHGTGCSSPTYNAKIILPAGMTLASSPAATFNGAAVTATSSGSVVTIPGTSAAGCYSVKLHLNCNTTAGLYEEDKNISWYVDFKCDASGACESGKLACSDFKFKAKYLSSCSKSCAANSIETSSFKAERATFGYANQNLTPPKLNASSSGVRLDAVYPCDSILVKVVGNQSGNISAPSMDIKYTLPGGVNNKFLTVDPTTAVCIITYKYTATGPTSTMTCAFPALTITPGAPVATGSGTTFTDHFAWTCVPPPAVVPPTTIVQPIIVSYEIKARYYVSNTNMIAAGSEYMIKDFRAQYSWYSAIPPAPTGPYTCSSLGAKMTVINPGHYFVIRNPAPGNTCTSSSFPIKLEWSTFGPCGSGDDFPNEFRQVGTMFGAIHAVIPAGFSYVPGSAVYTTGGSNGTTMYANANPSTGVGAMTFTPTGTSWPLQDKYARTSIQTFTFNIVPSGTSSCGSTNATIPLSYTWKDKDYSTPCAQLNSGQGTASVSFNSPDLRMLTFASDVYPEPNAKLRVRVASYSRYVGAQNVWAAYETMSGNFQYIVVKDQSGTSLPFNSYGAVNNIWVQLGTLAAATEKVLSLDLKYTGCTTNPERLTVKSSWGCNSYPPDPTLSTCPVKQSTVAFYRRYTNVQTEFISNTVDFCSSSTNKYMELRVRNIGYGRFYDPVLEFTLPTGFKYLAGSMQFNYGGSWTNVSNPVACTVPQANCYHTSVNAISSSIASDGLPSCASSNDYKFSLRYQLNAECGSDFSGIGNKNQVDASLTGRSFCNEPIKRSAQVFPQVVNMPPPAYTYSHPVFTSSIINRCIVNNSSIVHVKIKNDGNGSTGNMDSIKIFLPNNVTYNQGSYSNITNSPNAPTTIPGHGTGETTLKWVVLPNIPQNGFIEFTFTVSGLQTLNKPKVTFKLVTYMKHKAYCATSGDTCSMDFVRKWTRMEVKVICDPNACKNQIKGDTIGCIGDTLHYSAIMHPHTNYKWIAANGTVISQNDPQVSIQWNTLPGLLVLMTKDSVSNCTNFDSLLVLPDSNCIRCDLVADAGPDVSACEDSVQIGGHPTATGGKFPYTYTWTPATGLSNSAVSNPKASPLVKTTYMLIVTSGNCSDTDMVVVYPHLNVNAGLDQEICDPDINKLGVFLSHGVQTSVVLGGIPSTATGGDGPGSYTYSWTPTTGLDNPAAEHPVASPIVTTTYTVTVTSGNCTRKDSVVVTVYDCTKSCIEKGVVYSIETDLDPNVNAGNAAQIEGDSIACPGDTIRYSAISVSNAIYSWTPVGGTIVSQNDPDVVINWTTVPAKLTVIIFDRVNHCMLYDTLNITPDSNCSNTHCNLRADAGPDQYLCGQDSAHIGGSPSATGGTGPYTYLWTPALGLNNPTLPNPMASPAVTTTYVLTVHSGNCTAMDTVVVHPKLLVDAGSNRVLCNPSIFVYIENPPMYFTTGVSTSTVLGGIPNTATGGEGPSSYTYSWTPTAGLDNPAAEHPVASPDSTTIYRVTVTSGGCSVSDEVEVRVVNCTRECVKDNYIEGQNKACPGDTSIYRAGQYPNILYNWTVTGGTIVGTNNTYLIKVAWVSLPGVITLTTFDTVNLCITRDTLTVNRSANCDNLPCAGAATFTWKVTPGSTDVQFSGHVAASPGTIDTTWTWNFGDGSPLAHEQNPLHTYAAPGTYYVCMNGTLSTATKNCTFSFCDSIIVPCNLHADAGQDKEMCNRDSVQIGGSPAATGGAGASSYVYSWTPSTGLSNPNVANPYASPSVTTLYILKVTSGICTATDTVIVYPKLIVNAGPDQIICKGPTPTNTGTGTHPSAITIGGSPTANGGKGAGSYTYSWTPTQGLSDPNASNPVASPDNTTTYTVNVTSGTCSSSDMVTVTVQDCALACYINAQFSASNQMTVNPCLGCYNGPTNTVQFTDQTPQPATGTIIIKHFWNFGDGVGTSTTQNPLYTYANPNKYNVMLIVTAVNAVGDTCIDTVTNVVPVGDPTKWTLPRAANADEEMSVTEVGQQELSVSQQHLSVQLYPNPFGRQLTIAISLPKSDKIELDVLDIQGRSVQHIVSSTLDKGNHNFIWNVDEKLNQGVYIIQLKTNNEVKQWKALLKE